MDNFQENCDFILSKKLDLPHSPRKLQWFLHLLDDLIQNSISLNPDQINFFIETVCKTQFSSLVRTIQSEIIDHYVENLLKEFIHLIQFLSFSYYPQFLKASRDGLLIFSSCAHENPIYSQSLSDLSSVSFLDKIEQYLKQENISFFNLFHICDLFSIISKFVDPKKNQQLHDLIYYQIVQNFQSHRDDLLNDKELFQNFFKLFFSHDQAFQACLDFLMYYVKNAQFATDALDVIYSLFLLNQNSQQISKYFQQHSFYNDLFSLKEPSEQTLAFKIISISFQFIDSSSIEDLESLLIKYHFFLEIELFRDLFKYWNLIFPKLTQFQINHLFTKLSSLKQFSLQECEFVFEFSNIIPSNLNSNFSDIFFNTYISLKPVQSIALTGFLKFFPDNVHNVPDICSSWLDFIDSDIKFLEWEKILL